jgi:uncharacterized protein (DUF1330 family)
LRRAPRGGRDWLPLRLIAANLPVGSLRIFSAIPAIPAGRYCPTPAPCCLANNLTNGSAFFGPVILGVSPATSSRLSGWEWLPDAQKAIKAAGGEYVAGGFKKTTVLMGDPPPNRVVVIKYPNVDAVKAWWQDNKPLLAKIEKFTTIRSYSVEAVEPK